ncbi:OmpA family protein [Sediminicola sp. 1XM1-17]|uniref:OmpA family protein n=1 Tax=Sediminicola sp. 1XM1-17 TaxID=3127702 RepID=UPI0030774DD3
MVSKPLLTLFLVGYASVSMGQNLIENPSFEMNSECPKRMGNFNIDLPHWSTPTRGTTDYFNSCSTLMGTNDNFKGKQEPFHGKGYAGLYVIAPEDYREYIQAEISSTLKKGKKYRISFYVSLAEKSDYAIRELGVLFAEKKVAMNSKNYLSKTQIYSILDNSFNFQEVSSSKFMSSEKKWVKLSTEFTALGSENFMILGNFNNNTTTRRIETKKDLQIGAYYYIDMVSLVGIDKDVVVEQDYELNKTHIFKDVLFEFDRSHLLETEKKGIDALYAHLMANSSFKVMIKGHTDKIGSASYNKKLSAKRAEAVANYLLQSGLEKERIIWKGFGASIPIGDNGTEEGRQRNRRVEFILSKEVQ